MKLRALINLLRRTERMLGAKGPQADVWIGQFGSQGDLRGLDLRNLETTHSPDVLLRAQARSDGKSIVP